MRYLVLFFVFSGAMCALRAQEPLSEDDALKLIYSQYDAGKKTAHWVCTRDQEKKTMHAGWPCSKKHQTVSVSVLLMAKINEDGTERTYIATSAKPSSNPDESSYDCHACAPAIGVGVVVWAANHWILESTNAAVGFYGGWGNPPEIALVQVGQEKHALILSTNDLAQGYAWSTKFLLMPLDKTVAEVWNIQDEQDNEGAIDPDDKLNKEVPYKSSATFKFYAADDGISRDYYDIEVISRGSSRVDLDHPLKQENWTEIYRFSKGKYRLLRRKEFTEIKKATKELAH